MGKWSGTVWQFLKKNQQHRITVWSKNFTSGEITESRDLKRYLCTNFHSCITHNSSQKVITTQISIRGWKDAQNVVYTYNGILFTLLNEFLHTLQHPWTLRMLCWYGTSLQCPQLCGWDKTNSHRLPSPVEEKGEHSHSLTGRVPLPLPWQAFIAFLGTLHWGWSSFTMHRFALGGYLLHKTKERMLLITSKKRHICKCKGKSGWTGYTSPWKV